MTRSIHYETAFDWNSVNEPVDDAQFQYESMQLPVGTGLVDVRSGDRERLGAIGVDTDGQRPFPAESARAPWFWLLIGGNGLLIIALAMFILFKRKAS